MEPQRHYHYERIRLGDKIKYAVIGAAVGFGIFYYSGWDLEETVDKVQQSYQDARPRLEGLLRK